MFVGKSGKLSEHPPAVLRRHRWDLVGAGGGPSDSARAGGTALGHASAAGSSGARATAGAQRIAGALSSPATLSQTTAESIYCTC